LAATDPLAVKKIRSIHVETRLTSIRKVRRHFTVRFLQVA